MRVLLATDGTWGDVGPLLAVARELGRRGHEVRALLNPSFVPAAGRLGIAVEPVGTPWEERLRDTDPASLMQPISGTLRVLRNLLLPEITSWALASQRAYESFRPDAGLTHHIAWGPLCAWQRRALPVAATFLAPAVLLSGEDPGRPVAELPPPPRPVARLSRRVMRLVFRRLLDRPAGERLAAAGLPAPRDLYSLAERTAHALLGLWSPTLRGPAADDPPSLHVCGYAFPVEPDPLPQELERFLASGTPPVVVTLGTSARESGVAVYSAAAEACARLGRRAVLLTGTASRPGTLPPGVVAFDEAPHGKLLSHACAVVHHGGAGTCAQALRAGRPGVIVPFGHDQADNAWRAARLGGSRIVRRRRADAKRLAAALGELLASDAAREAARRVGAAISREDGVGEAARRVEGLAGAARRPR